MAQDDIQGQVVDAQGNPVDGAIVELTKSYQSSPDSRGNVFRTTTDSNGNYIFEGHPDGDGTTQEWHVSCYNHDGTAYVNSFNNPGVTADLPSNAIPDSALTQDLVAWYRFEDGDARDYTATLDAQFADSTAYDGTVNGATFQSSGGVTDLENGANSGAFDFDGTNDNIDAPTLPPHNTVCVWVREDTVNEFGTIIDTDMTQIQSRTSNNSYLLDSVVAGDPPSNIGQYTHLAVTVSSSGTVGYINGVNVGSSSDGVSPSSGVAKIGAEIGEDSRTFIDGRMDDLRIYDRQLNDSEISNIYNATKP